MCCKCWFHNYVGVLEMFVKALIFFPGLCICCTAECVAHFLYNIVLLLVILDFTHFPTFVDDWQWNNGHFAED